MCSAARRDAPLLVDGLAKLACRKLLARGLLFVLWAVRWVCATIPSRNRMMTDPASAIKREVHQLVDRQIATLRQPSGLEDFSRSGDQGLSVTNSEQTLTTEQSCFVWC